MIDAESVVRQHRDDRAQTARMAQARLDRLGRQRLIVFLIGIIMAGAIWGAEQLAAAWMSIPIVIFVGLLIRYDAVMNQLARAERSTRFFDRILLRIRGEPVAEGPTGERFLKTPHLAALDLDLFGGGSLFERLCTARTRPGEETLAAWLLEPALVTTIQQRQESVRELAPRLDLRERIALLGAELPPVDLQRLVKWGERPPAELPGWLRPAVHLLGLLNVLVLALVLVDQRLFLLFLLLIGISSLIVFRVRSRVEAILSPVEPASHDLALLSGLLHVIESESFQSARLREVQARMAHDGQPPSRQIAELLQRVDWLNARRNQFFAPFALLLMWKTRLALAFERWRLASGPHIARWVEGIGEIEALASLAAYTFENPEDPFPHLSEQPAHFVAEGIAHPLLPKSVAVRNDVTLLPPVQLLLVSGSNMSGKSTLLRSIGTNVVLALAGGPVRARSMRLCPLRIGATLRVQDSLLAGKSRFFAEISRVREILEATTGPLPVLFLLDEIFHGTNSHDRVLGAEVLIRRLLEGGAIGLVTTHDLTLTQAAERLGERAINVHFADHFENGEMVFDYRMRPGVVPHSNALALMRAIGLDV